MSQPDRACIGLYCGTFNPIHNGHLLIAQCARDQFNLEKIIFVTSPAPPHRSHELLAAEERFQMVQLAVEDNQFFEASRMELDRSGPSYTIDTVRDLKKRYDGDICLIIGGDNLKALASWHEATTLIGLCKLLVAPRLVYETAGIIQRSNCPAAAFLETVEPEQYDLPGADISIIDFPAVAISSSLIRERLRKGQTILYMVPNAVQEILLRKGHYVRGHGDNDRATQSSEITSQSKS